MSKNEILLRRKGLVEIENQNTNEENNLRYVATINKNIESLGYTLSPKVIEKLSKKDVDYLLNFSNELVDNLKALVGANVVYSPFYANFPDEVMNMSDAELYFNAILHYINRDFHNFGMGEVFEEPQSEKIQRVPLMESMKLKIIDLGTTQDKENIIRNLLKSSISYSAQDRKDIETYLKEDDILKYMPEKFENRENYAFIMSKLLDYKRFLPQDFEILSKEQQETIKSESIKKSIEDATKLKDHCKTATDVLRIYTGLCDGDISLAENSKFKAIPRPQRRFLLSLMEESSELSVHMSARPEKFKRAFRYLHVDEFVGKKGGKRFSKTSEAINNIRDGKYERSFESELTSAIEWRDLDLTLGYLVQKPGIFARKLDEVLRKFDDSERILFYFKQESTEINPRLLLSVRQHFKERMVDKDFRIFNPKGNTGKVFYTPNELTKIESSVAQAVVNICDEALIKQFRTKGNMGKVYISEALKGYKAPMVLRNLSPESKIITRGSKISVGEDKDVLRAFIWWKDDSDFDLAISGYDENWNKTDKDEISYRNYKTEYGCHSGDITYQRDNGIEGECEFIDINLRKAREAGIRYLVYQVYNYSGRYMDQAECKFGYMERENLAQTRENRYNSNDIFPYTGEIFEPLTVKNIMNLSAHTKTAMPLILDTEERKIIWADMEMGSNARINNVQGNLTGATAAAYSCVHDEKPELYDLLLLHAIARGELTDKKEEADEIFDIEEGTTPFDIDTIVARFLNTDKDEFCLEYTQNSQEVKSELEEVKEEKQNLENENSDLDTKIKAQKEKASKLFKKLEVLGLTEGMTLEEFLGVEFKDEQ